MFDSLKPGHMQLVVDPPPRGIFTYEDTVTGRVIFDSTKEFGLGYVYVFFHGWVSTRVVKANRNQYGQGPASGTTIDKEILFQVDQKVYQGRQNVLKGMHFEWPFRFDFRRPELVDPSALPTSGKYGLCSVEYKVAVACAHINQDEALFKRMFNPDDILFQKDSPVNLDALRGNLAKHLGVGAEQLLQFTQIRPYPSVGGGMAGPFNADLHISGHHLPNIQYNPISPPQNHGLFHHTSESEIPFVVHLNVPQNIVEGSPFPVYISVTSSSIDWMSNPPPVQLTSFNMKLLVRTMSRASMAADEDDKKETIVDAKNLSINIGPQPLDLGQFFSPTLTGFGIVPSFNTRLLQREYDLPVEVAINIAGKSFKADFPISNSIYLLSRIVATETTPQQDPPRKGVKKVPPSDDYDFPQTLDNYSGPSKLIVKDGKVRLRHTYIGRLRQDDGGPLQPDSIREAALAFTRVLTAASIQLDFPGGSSFKLLEYRSPHGSMLNDRDYDQRQDDREVIRTFMRDNSDQFAPVEYPADVLGVYIRYSDAVQGGTVMIQIPCEFLFTSLLAMQNDFPSRRSLTRATNTSCPAILSLQQGEHWQNKWVRENRDRTDDVKIDPVSLLNYRLDTALSRQLNEAEASDFEGLLAAFEGKLHHHRKHINVNTARVAAGRYPVIQRVMAELGVELGAVEEWKGPSPGLAGVVKQPALVPAPTAGHGDWYGQNANFGVVEEGRKSETESHEEGLVKGFKNLFHHKHHDK